MGLVLRKYQERAFGLTIEAILEGYRRILLCGPCACHAAGQGILMADGSIRAVETIREGDTLMGPDSRPRTVMHLYRGHGDLFSIVPNKGRPWKVNVDHILTLIPYGKGDPVVGHKPVDVSLRQYMGWSKTAKFVHKLFRVPVEFPSVPSLFQDDYGLPLDPYFLGVILGDGSLRPGGVAVTTMDAEIEAVIRHQATLFGLTVRADANGGRCPTYHLSGIKRKPNPIAVRLRAMGIDEPSCDSKRVPLLYRVSNRAARLEVLAGLLDTDGSLSGKGYDFISKSPFLADDIAFIARSLGLAANVSVCRKSCQTGAIGTYHRVSIYGDTDMVPCRLPRKRSAARWQAKNVLRTSFTVEPAGSGEFFGFALDGDGRYLLDDFTVTHNSGKTALYLALALRWQSIEKRTLVLAPQRELVNQPAARLDAYGVPYGVIMAGDKRVNPDAHIQIATVQTLAVRGLRPPADIVVCDEAHGYTAKTRRAVLDAYPDALHIGLTATPVPATGSMGDLYDKLIQVIQPSEAIRDGWLVPVVTYAYKPPDLTGVRVSGGDFRIEELAAAMQRAQRAGGVVEKWLERGRGRPTLMFACGIPDSKELVAAFQAAGVRAAHVDGTTPDDERAGLIAAVASGQVEVLSSADLLSVGVDIPEISCILGCRSTMSLMIHLQTGGRGLRPSPGKRDLLYLDLAGNVFRETPHGMLGLLEWDRTWSLSGRPKRDGKSDDKVPGIQQCPSCYAISPSEAEVCTLCQKPFPAKKRTVREAKGDLQLVDPAMLQRIKAAPISDGRIKALAKWIAEGRARGWKPNAPHVRFRALFHRFPTTAEISIAERALRG